MKQNQLLVMLNIESEEEVKDNIFREVIKKSVEILNLLEFDANDLVAEKIVNIFENLLYYYLNFCRNNVLQTSIMIKSKIGENKKTLFFDDNRFNLDKMSLSEKFELLIGLSSVKRVEFNLFNQILKDLNIDWDFLYIKFLARKIIGKLEKEPEETKVYKSFSDIEEMLKDFNLETTNIVDIIIKNIKEECVV